jgi:hypothetical protein
MKQITRNQLEKMALADKREVERWTEYSAADWLKENARHVAGIETGRMDKTLYGEWPKGWKAEMKRAASEKARADLIERFRREHVFELDGALWLRSMDLIEAMKKDAA